MRLLLTTNARLYKSEDGKYWTNLVYGYDFFLRYLYVFDEVRLVAHTQKCRAEDTENMLRVDGKNLEVYEVPFPHGKLQYLRMYRQISNAVKQSTVGCDAAILRIPDQLAFQIYPILEKNKIPIAVEVTSDSWEFFSPDSVKSVFRPFLRIYWHINQKKICANALGVSYVTKSALQRRYPPKRAIQKDGFTTFYTNADLNDVYFYRPRVYSTCRNKTFTIIHVSTNIGNRAKGYIELVTALGKLNNKGIKTKLVLVGGGSLSKETQTLINDYDYKDYVRLTGLLATPELLSAELKKADMFVFPSYREGLPRVLLEAMASGLPCVATELPGIQEILDQNCLVPVKDINELANKIEMFIKNTEKLEEQSLRNFNKAHEFKSDIIQKKRTVFYESLRDRIV